MGSGVCSPWHAGELHGAVKAHLPLGRLRGAGGSPSAAGPEGSRPCRRDSHPQEGTSSSGSCWGRGSREQPQGWERRARCDPAGSGLRARERENQQNPHPKPRAHGECHGGMLCWPAAAPQPHPTAQRATIPKAKRNPPRFLGKLCLHTCGSPGCVGAAAREQRLRVGAPR